MLSRADVAISKSDYFLIAQKMGPDELPADVTEKLNVIQALVCR